MSLIIIKWLKKILKFWSYRLGNWLLKTLDQLTRYTITKYLTGLNLGSVWFALVSITVYIQCYFVLVSGGQQGG